MSGDPSYGGGLSQRAVHILVALLIGAVMIGFLLVKGCQEGPFGRRQFVTLNPQEEVKLGAQAYQEVLRKQADQVVRSGAVVDDVKRVTSRLVRATTSPDFLQATKLKEREYKWEVEVVRSREVNAFCLPGGKMVCYTAILPVCQTDAGLATVMGHEIAHALARHGAERMTQQKIAQIGVTAAGASLGNIDPEQRRRVMSVLNAGAQFGILRYSRRHESEADHVGLFLMAAAGFDPKETVRFWERMRKMSSGGRTPEFLSTHPSHETRIRDLTNWIPQAMPLYEKSDQRGRPERLRVD
jgi:predicted Zn-dependent protease